MMNLDAYIHNSDDDDESIEQILMKKIETKTIERKEEEQEVIDTIKTKKEKESIDNKYQTDLEYLLSLYVDLMFDLEDIIEQTSSKYDSRFNLFLFNYSKKILKYRSDIKNHTFTVKGSDRMKMINIKRKIDMFINFQVFPMIGQMNKNIENHLRTKYK